MAVATHLGYRPPIAMPRRSIPRFVPVALAALVALAACHRAGARRGARAPRRAASGLSPCDHLDRKCVASSGARARIPAIRWTISPPTGWRFAEEADATVLVAGPTAGPVLAITTVEPVKGAAALRKARSEVVDAFVRRFGISLGRGRTADTMLRGVAGAIDVADASLGSWESEGATRLEAEGNVVVVAGSLGARELVLMGFAPERDFGALSEAIHSLRPMRGSQP